MPLVVVLLAALVLLAGCGGDDSGSGSAATATATATAAADACATAKPAKPVDAPKGLRLPEGAVVGEVKDAPPNVRAAGFVPLVPDAFVKAMLRDPELGILFKESEGHEAEVLVTDAKQRSFWKVVQACPEGSTFTVLTGKELAPGPAREAIRAKRKSG